ncbi:MAG: glycerol kinase GlpK [Robiginitomaculum sp.]|nr:glycerol kinase GlpK [Robiginitomaculum sp.]
MTKIILGFEMQDAILAIDQGTTSSRAITYDQDGGQICSAQQEFAQIYPQAGWVEHDPEVIWQTCLQTISEVVKIAHEKGYQPIACGITNQRETTIIWDRKTGEPIANAIVWQDRRTAPVCDELKDKGFEGLVIQQTGLLLDPYFSATKIAFLLDNVDGARERAKRGELAFGTVDSFLIWRLTNGKVHATDATNASRTALYDIRKGRWSEQLLELFNVPVSVLPEVKDCVADFGAIDVAHCGFEIPIKGVAGDQQAASIGQACFSPGELKSTFGTGSFLLVNTGDKLIRSKHRLLGTIAYQLDGVTTYALEGSILSAGSTIQWLRDGLEIIADASECETLAKSIPDTGGVYLVPAFAGLGAPHWDAEARGALLGLTRGSGKAQIVRAALEAVVYQTRDLVEALELDGVKLSRIRVDGGMVGNDWLLQFMADILGISVERPVNIESTITGVAALAAVGIGLFPSLQEFACRRVIDQVFRPQMTDGTHKELLFGWDNALQRVLNE